MNAEIQIVPMPDRYLAYLTQIGVEGLEQSFEKIIQCNHDRVLDINFSANFWRSVYLNDPNIATKIPKLLFAIMPKTKPHSKSSTK